MRLLTGLGLRATIGTLGLVSPIAYAQDCTPRLVGQIGGEPNDVAVVGDIAYVAYGNSGLLLVDHTQRPPVIVNQVPLDGWAEGVDIEGGLAVVVGLGKLMALDASDPENPFLLGTLDGFAYAQRVEIDGDLAYVADETLDPDTGLGLWKVIDLSDPASPSVLATVSAPNYTRQVAVGDGFCAVACEYGGVALYDITDPWAPVQIATHNAGEQYVSVAIDADRMAVLRLAGSSGPRIDVNVDYFDVSDPANPSVLGTGQHEIDLTTGWEGDIELRDGLAYVARMKHYISFDFNTNPGNPSVSVATGFPCFAQALIPGGAVVVGPYVHYSPDHDKPALSIVQHTGGLGINGQLTFPGPAVAWDVDVDGGLAAVADYAFGTSLIDVSDPANPVQVATLEYGGGGVDLVGDTLYLGGGALLVYDVSDPANPVMIGNSHDQRPTTDYVRRIGAWGDVVVGLGSQWYMFPFDVSDPAAPSWHKSIFSPTNIGSEGGEYHALMVHDGIAYACAGDDGFYAVDISDPRNPIVLGHDFANLVYAANMSYDSGHVYVSGTGLEIWDVTDPANISWAGYIHLDGYWETAVHVRDSIARVYARDGILIYDVADPGNPQLLAVGEIPRNYAYALHEHDGLVYSASSSGGLKIYDLTDCVACTYADLHADRRLNIDDIDRFVSLFLAGDLRADCDGGGGLSVDDVDCFVDSFLAGCP